MKHIRRIRDGEIAYTPVAQKDLYVIRCATTGRILSDANQRKLDGIGKDAVETVRQYCLDNNIEIMIRDLNADAAFIEEERKRNWLNQRPRNRNIQVQ